MIQGIRNTCSEYYRQLPKDTIKCIGLSALFSFTAVYLLTKQIPGERYDFTLPLVAGGVAALASLIYAVTVPIFNYIIGDSKITFLRELTKQVVNIGLTSVVFNYLTASKVNLTVLPIFCLSINLVKSFFGVIPFLAESVFDNEDFADEARLFFKDWSLDTPEGSGSIFVFLGP